MARYVVFAHRLPGTSGYFFIGSGPPDHAFRPQRDEIWNAITSVDPYEIVVLERHACPARARLREAELVHQHQPSANVRFREGPDAETLGGYIAPGERCDCSAPECHGREAARLDHARQQRHGKAG